MSDETADSPEMMTVFETPEAVLEFLEGLGIGGADPEEVVQEDGSIVLALGDRAITLERHETVGGVVITALIARVAGPELDGIVHDLMALNARPQTTGGLAFGLLDEEILVGSLILGDTIATPRTLSEAVVAVIESTDAWRTLIEQSGDSARTIAETDADDDPSSEPMPATFV